MITGHPGLGSDPPKQIGPGKGSHTNTCPTPSLDQVVDLINCDHE